jgi:hypothetical protein
MEPGSMDIINLDEYRIHWQIVVNKVMNIPDQ